MDDKSGSAVKESRYYCSYPLIIVFAIFILAYLLPVIIYARPFGTDVYTHMVYTKELYESASLKDFYAQLLEESTGDEIGIGYPFGLWLFGSVLAKVLGVGAFDVSYILPIVLVLVMSVLYFIFARHFLGTKHQVLMAVALMLSMPIVSINLLRYRSSVFVTVFLLAILYLVFNEKVRMRKITFLNVLLVFALVVSHTGSYLFLLTFAISYVFMYSLIWGVLHRRMYSLIAILLTVYVVSIGIFPSIHAQYETKATNFLTVGGFLSKVLGTSFPYDVSSIFYEEIFVNNSLIHALLWSAVIYSLCKMIIFIRMKVIKRFKARKSAKKEYATIPFIGTLRNVSHSVATTPFWIGPLQTALSIPGYVRLNPAGKCMLITACVITLLPAALYMGQTGALREIYYLLVIIPISGSAGLYLLMDKVSSRLESKIKKILFGAGFLVICSGIIIAPVVGNNYYLLPISGTDYEINGLSWLSGMESTGDKSIGYGYKHMVDVHSNIPNVMTRYGTETILFLQNMLNTFFSENSRDYVDGLYYTFHGRYIISSEKVVENLRRLDSLVRGRRSLDYLTFDKIFLDSNDRLDKVFSSMDDFNIYSYVPEEYPVIVVVNETGVMEYSEDGPEVVDAGVSYLVETDTYNIQLNKKAPEILYLGTSEIDFREEGYFKDYVWMSLLGGPYSGFSETYYFDVLYYPEITLHGNKITYKTVLSRGKNENLSTVIFSYTFHQKAIEKDIIIANDWITYNDDFTMRVYPYSAHYSPVLSHFTFYDDEDGRVQRTIYASDDQVKLDGLNFNRIYFNNGETGLYVMYDEHTLFPDEIRYRGSTIRGQNIQNYSYASVGVKGSLQPSQVMHVRQYISFGDEKTAEENIRSYNRVTIYPYLAGIVPITLVGYSGILDEDVVELTQTKMSGKNVTYALGIIPQEAEKEILDQLRHNIDFIAFGNVNFKGEYLNYTEQEKTIRGLREHGLYSNIELNGFVPGAFRFNLDTLKALEKNRFTHIVASPTTPYLGYLGRRLIKPTYLQGAESDILLIPITNPSGSNIYSVDLDDFVARWKRVINISLELEELSVLAWTQESVGGSYGDGLLEIVDYARDAGLTFVELDDLVRHHRLIQNVDSLVSVDNTSAVISSRNRNSEDLLGLTYVAVLSEIDGGCPYESEGGRIVRIKYQPSECRVYVSFDLRSGETRNMTIAAA